MSDDPTPEPVPVDPNDEPEQIRPSATGLVVPSDGTPSEHDSLRATDTDNEHDAKGGIAGEFGLAVEESGVDGGTKG